VASATWSTVGGGNTNEAADSAATVAGGQGNYAGEVFSVVGGGHNNTAGGFCATIGGGQQNAADNNCGVVAGGYQNTASGSYATVGGGYNNTAGAERATVGGGHMNNATGSYATVGGGQLNLASGSAAMVPGGSYNAARGNASFAAGNYARSNHGNSFVWGDGAALPAETVYTTASNQFRVRARGGTWFFSNAGMTSGVVLASGSNSWAGVCDSMNKTDFAPVDREELLRRVAELRVRYYRMKDQHDGTRHLGPVAQDFHAAFGVGENNTSINMADADGVLLAAVQALYDEMRLRDEAQQRRIAQLEAELAQLKK
jgi:hypothetical protein